MRRRSLLLTLLLSGCSVGNKEVTYNEMGSKPKASWDGNDLIVKTENSKENSALLIYEIQAEADSTNKLILIRGLQAPGKEFKNEFRIKIQDIQIENLTKYKIYWLDPDGKRTELDTAQP